MARWAVERLMGRFYKRGVYKTASMGVPHPIRGVERTPVKRQRTHLHFSLAREEHRLGVSCNTPAMPILGVQEDQGNDVTRYVLTCKPHSERSRTLLRWLHLFIT